MTVQHVQTNFYQKAQSAIRIDTHNFMKAYEIIKLISELYRPSRPTEKKVSLIFFTITFTNMQGFKKIWYTTLQMNTNHTSKFTTLHAMYIPYLVT